MAFIATDAVHLPFAMLIVFGTAKLLSELFEYFGQPGIVAEILAGILLGPNVLGWVQPNELILAFAEIGVMFLLFRVGLEVKASEFIRVGYPAALIALLGVILPFVAGWLLAAAFHHDAIESVFVGAAMVATSVGITAQFLASKGLLQARASRIILAAAVIDDVLGLIVLAVVTSMAKGNVNFAQLSLTAALAIGFTVMVVRWGTRAMRAILPQITQRLRGGEVQFTLAMCLLFSLSVLSVYAGVAAIIGAFLAGMALSETVDKRVHDLTNGVSELFTPFFLVGIGLRFNFTAFANVSTILFALVILVAAILSKVVGCGLPAMRGGKRDALRIGIGMIPRGEVGMVVAQIGLAMSVLSDRIFGVVVFMSVMTTLIAPSLLNWAYKDVKADGAEETMFRIG